MLKRKPGTELRRTRSGLTRSHRLPAASVGRRAGREEQARVYRQSPAEEWCAACGCSGPLDHWYLAYYDKTANK